MLDHHFITTDLCVVGGGLAGMCAAIAAARAGSKVVLMQERPVLGGNASGEIRMWVCGAKNCRETGIIEEIQLENLYRNPDKLWPVWDGILYGKVKAEPNITLLLNCSCCDAEMDGNVIHNITGWQMTTQSWITVRATFFADCSGDSILAPLTGAHYRVGRESADEFGEKISNTQPDPYTMGLSCLIQARRLDRPVSFIAPDWAKKVTREEIERRMPDMNDPMENFWYLELGGDRDSIHDTETVRDELVALAFGFWDYYKNSGEFEGSEYWQMDFLGFLPGKRESRRMMGEYIMTQTDVLTGGHFEDVIAYGGWPLDDHHPAGFYHEGNPNQWGDTPAPYGIPYRVLYSENIRNLFFAGRNVSMTHAAMSSARVMATCALLGQAVGEAAAMAVQYHTTPHGIYTDHLEELQERLMCNDSFLPYNKRTVSPITVASRLDCDGAVDLENLRNGIDRNNHTYGPDDFGAWIPMGKPVTYTLPEPTVLREIRVVFDSDLERVTVPGGECEQLHSMRCNVEPDSPQMHLPTTLPSEFCVEVQTQAGWEIVYHTDCNFQRCLRLKSGTKPVNAVRLTVQKRWYTDASDVHVFSFDLYK